MVAISEGADEVYFVLSWSERLLFRIETCESFLLVDRCHETVVLIACDKNVLKRNCIVLFRFNGKFIIAVTTENSSGTQMRCAYCETWLKFHQN